MPLPYQVRLDRTQKLYLGCKRAFDTLAAALLLTAAAPVMALVALAIKLESPAEPVLFCQPRVGIGYRSFRLYMRHGKMLWPVIRFLRLAAY